MHLWKKVTKKRFGDFLFKMGWVRRIVWETDLNTWFQTHGQGHTKKEFYKMGGLYFKSGKDACMSSNLKALHTYFYLL
jgi:hypothetical protein